MQWVADLGLETTRPRYNGDISLKKLHVRVLTAGFCAFVLQGAATAGEPAPLSPTIRGVEERARQVENFESRDFWRRMARGGTPLVEADPGSDSILVTFLWRGDARTKNVVVFSALSGWLAPGNRLHHLLRTDIWYRTYKTAKNVRFTYRISVNDTLVPFNKDPDWKARKEAFHLDPLNPRKVSLGGDEKASLFNGPEVGQVPADTVHPLTFGRLEVQKIGGRGVHIYSPKDSSIRQLGLAFVMDGDSYTNIVHFPGIVDRLISSGKVPPLVAALVESPDRQKDLRPNKAFTHYVSDVLLPYLEKRFPLSKDPARRVLVGSSLGGLEAAYLGYKLPGQFGNVIAQSGSYWWAPPGDPEPEWLARQYARSPLRPVRFYLDIGILETTPTRRGPTMITVNRHFRDVLCARGYDVYFQTFPGAHEYVNWRRTLPTALEFALGSNPPPATCPGRDGEDR